MRTLSLRRSPLLRRRGYAATALSMVRGTSGAASPHNAVAHPLRPTARRLAIKRRSVPPLDMG